MARVTFLHPQSRSAITLTWQTSILYLLDSVRNTIREELKRFDWRKKIQPPTVSAVLHFFINMFYQFELPKTLIFSEDCHWYAGMFLGINPFRLKSSGHHCQSFVFLTAIHF